MITIRQMERDWRNRDTDRLFSVLASDRVEGAFDFDVAAPRAILTAALAMVRMDELNQSCTPLFGQLLRAILAAQEPDGGWGDLAVTSVCLRALLIGNGQGAAVGRGMAYLAQLQKSEGIWPAIAVRRMQEDPATSAFILYQLSENAEFRDAVRFDDAVQWFDEHQHWLDTNADKWWRRAEYRCRLAAPVRRTYLSRSA